MRRTVKMHVFGQVNKLFREVNYRYHEVIKGKETHFRLITDKMR